MSKTPLSVGDFSDLLDRLGTDFGQWPEASRVAAECLLARSDEAIALLADAVAFDDAAKATQPKAPLGLAERIIAAAGSEKAKN